MPYKFNPVTGNLDYYEAGITPSETYALDNDSVDRLIDASSADTSELANVLMTLLRDLAAKNIINITEVERVNIKRGQPIGLMGVTYADDVN